MIHDRASKQLFKHELVVLTLDKYLNDSVLQKVQSGDHVARAEQHVTRLEFFTLEVVNDVMYGIVVDVLEVVNFCNRGYYESLHSVVVLVNAGFKEVLHVWEFN